MDHNNINNIVQAIPCVGFLFFFLLFFVVAVVVVVGGGGGGGGGGGDGGIVAGLLCAEEPFCSKVGIVNGVASAGGVAIDGAADESCYLPLLLMAVC